MNERYSEKMQELWAEKLRILQSFPSSTPIPPLDISFLQQTTLSDTLINLF